MDQASQEGRPAGTTLEAKESLPMRERSSLL